MLNIKHLPTIIIVLLFFGVGAFLRLYKIDYGLPYSFLNDELDIYYEVIRISQNYKFILPQDGFMGLAPDSYVYGMFPTYFLTFSTIILNKLISIIGTSVEFDFYFVYMRIINSLFSLLGLIFVPLIYKKIFKDSTGTLISLALALLNWKLIHHSHYLNHDTFLMVLTISSIYFLISYFDSRNKKIKCLNILLSAFLFGLASGTKITALLVTPIIGTVLLFKKDYKAIALYAFGTLLGFSLSNPFSIINFQSFFSRILLMRSLEAGVVLSSVDTNPLKYMISLVSMLTPAMFVFSFYAIYLFFYYVIKEVKGKTKLYDYIPQFTLIGIILIYIIFFSLSPRITERWLLPIIPIMLIWAAKGVSSFLNHNGINTKIKLVVIVLTVLTYLYYPYTVTKQLQIGKPRVNAYLWTKEYLEKPDKSNSKVLMYTSKGDRDPFGNLRNLDLNMFNVYESKGAQNSFPKNPRNYDIVVLYSSLEDNFENKYVKNKYPSYYQEWSSFIAMIKKSGEFNLIKSFETTDFNLLGVPEIFIYEKDKH